MKETSLTPVAPSPFLEQPAAPEALEALIAEQERDARSFRVFSVSVDAFPSGADLPERRRQLVNDPRHGTLNGYIHLDCRCAKCREASAAAKREQRARSRVDRGAYTYRLCCEACGSEDVRRERVYA